MKKLDVVFILDKSGSMSGSEDNTISSFNEYLEREKKNKYNTLVSTILFSDNYYYLHKRENIKNINHLTNRDYYVGGCTALYDALGNTINYFKKVNTDKVLFIIITDGYENASLEFNKAKITKLIKNSGFEFIYIGADIDSYAAGSDIGIRRENIANFKKDKKGTNLLFRSVGKYSEAMMADASTSRWSEELDEYINENKD